MTLNKTI